MRQIPGSAQPSSKVGLPLVFTPIRAPRQTALQPANALPCAYSHHLTLCENALAASFAGVVHPLHPLAGIDSARLLLFSGDAISYVSNCRTQSTSLRSKLFGDCFFALRRACSTHALGGPRQPLDRQLRYYSEGPPLARGLKWHW